MDGFATALVLSKALELGVTEYGISSNRMREANSIVHDRTTRITLNSAFMVASPMVYTEIKRRKPRLAKGTAIVLILGNSYLVYRNVKIINSRGGQR